MRAVSGNIRRIAAVVVVSAVLAGYASIAAAEGKQSKNETLLTSFIVWLQSRLDVPGG